MIRLLFFVVKGLWWIVSGVLRIIVRAFAGRGRSRRGRAAPGRVVVGRARVIDGDTLDISGVRIRLAGIDAPEISHRQGRRAKRVLARLCRRKTITARFLPGKTYGRRVATCYLPDGRDLSAVMVRRGMALDWESYSGGTYRSFEPWFARVFLWRVALKQGRRTRGK
ncbi:thermonuclease family protein [Palleronia sp. LCG004]|uniref:thermonuclease family protein n=1 Tax=Palleronia sp. LCG004 TaxID=3079304 RepID=UPI0029432069|nr:thermonuclease family protein [Palleronia sp. LCG004]WOI58028.1 thermonuclease family protein [Palleronia sp. LCG004]